MPSYADPTTPNLPSTEMPGWIDLLRELTGQQKPTWQGYLGSLADWQKDFLDVDPQAGFSAYRTLSGLGQGEGYQNWLDKQYNTYRGQYTTMAAKDPALFWSDFMSRLNPDADYNLLATPYERGQYQTGYGLSPTMRMTY